MTTAEPTAGRATASTAAPVVRSGAGPESSPVGDPVAIVIPSIGVDDALVPTGTLPDGTVAVPDDADVPGWYTGGPRPGEPGPSVIMGHVDSARTGPGVFFRLRDIEIGATVTVITTTGAVHFSVRSVERYPKDAFPTERVYGSVPEPALRLITCGGSFDDAVGHYRDNIVVMLVPAAPP